mmetsp:Transcript_11539/g.27688  ORF Transcript_11539/g.27688 Transcript_11539/m.27688 type:complete len:255 (-) Transcript_11539:159-923(-)
MLQLLEVRHRGGPDNRNEAFGLLPTCHRLCGVLPVCRILAAVAGGDNVVQGRAQESELHPRPTVTARQVRLAMEVEDCEWHVGRRTSESELRPLICRESQCPLQSPACQTHGNQRRLARTHLLHIQRPIQELWHARLQKLPGESQNTVRQLKARAAIHGCEHLGQTSDHQLTGPPILVAVFLLILLLGCVVLLSGGTNNVVGLVAVVVQATDLALGPFKALAKLVVPLQQRTPGNFKQFLKNPQTLTGLQAAGH